MDVQDEIERQRKIAEHPAAPDQPQKKTTAPSSDSPSHGGPASPLGEIATPVSASQGEPLAQHASTESGTCERCGVSALQLYQYKGRKLCASCTKEEGGSIEPAKSFFHKMHEYVAKLLLFKNKKN